MLLEFPRAERCIVMGVVNGGRYARLILDTGLRFAERAVAAGR